MTLWLMACNNTAEQTLPESPIVAVVGEEKITMDLLNAFLQANGVSSVNDAVMKKALDSLIEEVAIANIAKKKNLPLAKEQLNTLKYLKIKTMANNAKSDYLSNKEITDAEILKEYEAAQKQVGGNQYHVHHLLYKDEIEAIKQREKIKSTEDYIMLELLHTQQNPNMKNIGDIGWLALSQLPEGFRGPLNNALPGTVLQQVVNSQFGAHIVYFEAIKKLDPPKLEDVKPGIVQSIKTKQLSKFIQLAKAKAHIEIKK